MEIRKQGPGLRLPILAGFGVIALLSGSLVAWSVSAPLESAAIAPGAISVESSRKTIKHLEGGIVREILVAEGEQVVAGQPLIRLDDTMAKAKLQLLRGRYATAVAQKSRLLAERHGRDSVEFPDWLERGRADPRLAEIITGQSDIFDARRDSLNSQIAILSQRIRQWREEIKGLTGQIDSGRKELAILGEEIGVVQDLVDRKLTPRPRLLVLQRTRAEKEGFLSQAQAGVAGAEMRIREARLKIADLRTARQDEVTGQLRDVQGELLDLEQQISAAEDVMKRTLISAPLDGTVVVLQVHTVGGVIGAGEPLLQIVPSQDRLIVEAQIDTRDIDVVRPGLVAHVALTPFNSRYTAPVEGEVVSISADRLVDQRSGTGYYLARIKLRDEPKTKLPDASLYPGMPVQVMIVTGQRTLLDYFLKPLRRSFNVAFRED